MSSNVENTPLDINQPDKNKIPDINETPRDFTASDPLAFLTSQNDMLSFLSSMTPLPIPIENLSDAPIIQPPAGESSSQAEAFKEEAIDEIQKNAPLESVAGTEEENYSEIIDSTINPAEISPAAEFAQPQTNEQVETAPGPLPDFQPLNAEIGLSQAGESQKSPFQKNIINENDVPATYEEAIRHIVLLNAKIKVKDNELLDSQRLIESALAENRDKIEQFEQFETKNKQLEAELDKIMKIQSHEHEKRRLHLLHVRDLKHAIVERDHKIQKLEALKLQSGDFKDKRELEKALNVSGNEEIKNLQSEIFYREIEIERLNSVVAGGQQDIVDLKTKNEELESRIIDLSPELKNKDAQIESITARLKEAELALLEWSELSITPEEITSLRTAAEIKDFLEEKLDELSNDEATQKSGEDRKAGANADNLGVETANYNARENVESLKERLHKIIDERAAGETEVKKLQSDIFYSEVEIDKLNGALSKAQAEIISLEAENGELRLQIEALGAQRDKALLKLDEINIQNASLSSDITRLNELYEPFIALNISAGELEKLKLADEMRSYLEEELDKNLSESLPAGENDSENASLPDEKQEHEDKTQINEIEEIKEKFQKLIAERDKAIELLDKFDVESKTKENELKALRAEHKTIVNEKDSIEKGLKEKDEELQGLYAAFSRYKEESGFMSRENKILKEERGSLVEELGQLKDKLKELEENVTQKEREFQAFVEENEAKLKTLSEEKENAVTLYNSNSDTMQSLKLECETAEANYQNALSEYYAIKSNAENLFSVLKDALGGGNEDEDVLKTRIENEIIIVRTTNDESTPIPEILQKLSGEFELKISDCSVESFGLIHDEHPGVEPVAIMIMIPNEKDILRVFDVKDYTSAPILLYSSEPVAIHKITDFTANGIISDYIDAQMPEKILASIFTRIIEGKISNIKNLNIKKDSEEMKLRESVALTIDNRVKAGRIEALNNRVEQLKQTNKKLQGNIKEIQQLFDRIISTITTLSLQEIPQNIGESFGEITDILLKVTTIKL